MKNVFETRLIEGVVGTLEVRHSALVMNEVTKNSEKRLVVLSHPHPLHGGTMSNKVMASFCTKKHPPI